MHGRRPCTRLGATKTELAPILVHGRRPCTRLGATSGTAASNSVHGHRPCTRLGATKAELAPILVHAALPCTPLDVPYLPQRLSNQLMNGFSIKLMRSKSIAEHTAKTNIV